MMAQLFSRFKFGQTYFVISQAVADFNFIYIIRFVFLLAFQCCISNCSFSKTCKDTAKRKLKVENDGPGGGGVLCMESSRRWKNHALILPAGGHMK